MRLGLVCPYDLGRPGGVQAQVRGLAEQLKKGGDEVRVFGPGLPQDIEGVDLGGSVTVPGNASRVPVAIDPRIGSVIERESGDLDLLHVHEPLMPLVSLLALRAGRPVVATFHAAPGTWGRGFYAIVRSQLRRILGPNVRRVTAVSRVAASPLPDDLDVTIIPNGVDVDAFRSDVERTRGRVSFLGRDERRKGLDVILQAWPQVTEAAPEAQLVVMGADRSIAGITWMGRVDDATKADVLASSAIYVAPNLGGESFGIVLVEAMAAGTPVVASDLPSFREVGGDVARYFATGDPTSLVDVLVGLLRDDDARVDMSARGAERARDFDWDHVTTEYRAIYEAALS